MSRISATVMESSSRSSPVDEGDRRRACALRPASEVGDGEQRLPHVLRPIVELVGEVRPTLGQVVVIRLEPVREPIAEVESFWLDDRAAGTVRPARPACGV